MDKTNEILTLSEVAGLIGCFPHQIHYAIRTGRVPEVPIRAGRRLFSVEDVAAVKRAMGNFGKRAHNFRPRVQQEAGISK